MNAFPFYEETDQKINVTKMRLKHRPSDVKSRNVHYSVAAFDSRELRNVVPTLFGTVCSLAGKIKQCSPDHEPCE